MNLLDKIFDFHWFDEARLAESFRQLNRRALKIVGDAEVLASHQADNLKSHSISAREIESTRRTLEEAVKLLVQTEGRMKDDYAAGMSQGEGLSALADDVAGYTDTVGDELTKALAGGTLIAGDPAAIARLLDHVTDETLSEALARITPQTRKVLLRGLK